MTRQEAVDYLLGELREYSLLWDETYGQGTGYFPAASVAKDREALLALGVTEQEIEEAEA